MCLGFLQPQVQPPNEKCRKFVIVLKVLCFMEFIVMVSGFAVGTYSSAIFAIIFMALLACTWRSLKHGTLVIYMYCSILMYVTSLVYFLGKIQNGGNVCPPGNVCARFVLSIYYFVYYVTSSIICFFIYREFKGIEYENDPNFARFFAQQQRNQRESRPQPDNTNDIGSFAPTYGTQGQRDTTLPPVRPPRNLPTQEHFKAFEGQGVSIG